MHFILLLVYIIKEVWSTVAPTNLLATRVGPCIEIPSTIVSISEMSLNTRLYDSNLTGDVNITQDIEDGWILKATMQKCQDIRNLDTCDYLRSFNIISNGCSDDEDNLDDQEILSMFFHHAHPRLSCPIKAGNYYIVGYPIFTEDNYQMVVESKISTSVFGYTLKLEGYNGMVRFLCVEAYMRLLYVREYTDPVEWFSPTTEPSSEEDKAESEE